MSTVDENVRERVVGSISNETMESESEDKNRSLSEK